jgi:glyoxylase-like metal-dependent hydrolase (beta-lactamase superfamily II)
MLVETFPVGAFQCNCVIVADEATREAIVIDPGDSPRAILERVRAHGLTVRALIHTHAHLDHILGTREVQQETNARIHLHPADAFLYENLPMQCGMFGWNAQTPAPVDAPLADGEELRFGAHALTVIHTPGHTPGSVCFELARPGEAPLLFSGDTLFRRGIGRTDLWGGDFDQILTSIRSRIFTRSADTIVLPGHGPKTLVGDEIRKNPFLT